MLLITLSANGPVTKSCMIYRRFLPVSHIYTLTEQQRTFLFPLDSGDTVHLTLHDHPVKIIQYCQIL